MIRYWLALGSCASWSSARRVDAQSQPSSLVADAILGADVVARNGVLVGLRFADCEVLPDARALGVVHGVP